MRILIADDEVFRMELDALRTRHHHKVVAVMDGTQAWGIDWNSLSISEQSSQADEALCFSGKHGRDRGTHNLDRNARKR